MATQAAAAEATQAAQETAPAATTASAPVVARPPNPAWLDLKATADVYGVSLDIGSDIEACLTSRVS